MSSISTHVLDTSTGRPAEGIEIIFYKSDGNDWGKLASGITDKDGRISEFTGKDKSISDGIYKMRFETGNYFKKKSQKNFYPYAEIVFEITSDEHYHIPLLLSPFGYSTYRGS